MENNLFKTPSKGIMNLYYMIEQNKKDADISIKMIKDLNETIINTDSFNATFCIKESIERLFAIKYPKATINYDEYMIDSTEIDPGIMKYTIFNISYNAKDYNDTEQYSLYINSIVDNILEYLLPNRHSIVFPTDIIFSEGKIPLSKFIEKVLKNIESQLGDNYIYHRFHLNELPEVIVQNLRNQLKTDLEFIKWAELDIKGYDFPKDMKTYYGLYNNFKLSIKN